MTNYEKYKSEIDRIARMGIVVALDKNTKKVVRCGTISCLDCLFANSGTGCHGKAVKWADEEYKEPAVDWSKVPIDTQILVRDIESAKWHKRHFAGVDEHGRVMTWDNGKTSWSCENRKRQTEPWNYARLAEVEAEKHPKKTRKDVLLEKFPNAHMDGDIPYVCAGQAGLVDGWQCNASCIKIRCIDCWNTEVTE